MSGHVSVYLDSVLDSLSLMTSMRLLLMGVTLRVLDLSNSAQGCFGVSFGTALHADEERKGRVCFFTRNDTLLLDASPSFVLVMNIRITE